MTAKEEASNCLRDAPQDQCFWVNNGPILKNLEELANALPQMSDEIYRHHVNGEKNDFSRWINDIIGDKKLAKDLLISKNKEYASKKIRNRLSSLKKKAGQ